MSVASTQSERVSAGNVAKIVDRLSKDYTKQNVLSDVQLRKTTSSSSSQRAVVRYSYTASHDDELTLKEGDEIEVIEAVEDGWMRGRLNGRLGVFPTNFVTFSGAATSSSTPSKAVEEKKRSNSVSSTATASTQNGAESVPNKVTVTKSLTFTRKFPESTTNITVPVERSERPLPSKLGESELAPFLKGGGVRAKSSLFSDHDVPTKPPPPPTSEPPKVKEMARVLYTYKAQHPDELDLPEEGVMITVINKNCTDPGWFEGELNGKRGLFPDNFVKLIEVPVERPTAAPPTLPTKPKPVLMKESVVKSDSSTVSDPPLNSRRSVFSPSTSQSDNFKNAHSRIADQLKIALPGAGPPKFSPKPVPSESSSSIHAGGDAALSPAQKPEEKEATKLQHLTTNRPKGPQKRPPSMFGSGRKSDDTLDSPELTISLEPELVKEKDIRSMTHGGDKSHVGEKPSHHFPAAKELVSPPAKVLPKGTVTTSVPSNPVLNPTAPSVDESEYVSRREYNELLKTVEELSKRIALLELKL